MNKELCYILKQKILSLPFTDVVAGLAQTLTMDETTGGDGVDTTVTKRFPVSDDTNQDPEIFGKEIDLSPNSARRSIIFFEDYGLTVLGKNHSNTEYQSNVRLLAWLNREKLGYGQNEMISGKTIAAIIATLQSRNPENVFIFSRLIVSVARIPPQDAALFGKYSFKEADRQYLRPPFEFFGIDFTAKYVVANHCVLNSLPQIPIIQIPQKGDIDEQIQVVAGQNLSSGRVVVKNNGKIYYFEPSNELHAGRVLGVTVTSGVTGSIVKVQVGGLLEDAGFDFSIDQPVYVGADGQLTTTLTETKVLQRAGVAINTNKLFIDFELPLIRNV